MSITPRAIRALDALRVIRTRFESERPDAPATVTRTEIERIIEDISNDYLCPECGHTNTAFVVCGECVPIRSFLRDHNDPECGDTEAL